PGGPLAAGALGKGAALQAVQPATRYRYAGREGRETHTDRGQNPPVGAVIHYYLPAKPRGDVTLEVLDAKGQTVQTLTSKKEEEEDEEAPKRPSLVEKEEMD